MKKIITCASYGGTGSSAVTDLMKEFNNVKSLGEFEFSIAHDLDGISDLQHYLVDDWNRIKHDEAIYRFTKLIERNSKQYNKYFKDKFDSIARDYIDNLIIDRWNGYLYNHRFRKSSLYSFINYSIPDKIQRFIIKLDKFSKYERIPILKKSNINFSYPKERFYEYTKLFYRRLFNEVTTDISEEYIALDQLVPSSNIERYINYFDNIKIIIVDRDPRDLYILNKIFWKEGWIPCDNVETFIVWFKTLRESRNKELLLKQVKFIQFENLIFDYEKSIDEIIRWIGMEKSNHIRRKQFFNPEESIKNVELWKRYNNYHEDIMIIEKELKNFCYYR